MYEHITHIERIHTDADTFHSIVKQTKSET